MRVDIAPQSCFLIGLSFDTKFQGEDRTQARISTKLQLRPQSQTVTIGRRCTRTSHLSRYSTYAKRFAAMPGNLKGALTLLVAAAGFSIMVMLVKLAGERLHVTQILLVRQVIMMAIVMPSVLNHFPGCLKTERLDPQVIRVVFALVAMLCGFYSIIHMTLADAVAIGFAKSFFVTIFAIWFLKEVVGLRRWLAVATGFVGVIVMMRPGSEGFDPNSIYALLGAAGAGLVMVIIRKLSETDKPITTLSYQAFLVAICVAIPAYYYWQSPTATEWALMVAIGAMSYGAQLLNIYAYSWGEASVLVSLDYVRLLYATLLGWLIFDARPGPLYLDLRAGDHRRLDLHGAP